LSGGNIKTFAQDNASSAIQIQTGGRGTGERIERHWSKTTSLEGYCEAESTPNTLL
jgi:hypothetical protein